MTNAARKEIIANLAEALRNVEGNADAAYYLSESLAEQWGAGIFDECADVYFRAVAACERVINGGKALR